MAGVTVFPLDDRDPRSVGPYTLVGRLGEGGMGRVYYALSHSARPLAIKVIRPELAASPEFRARFAREVDAVRRTGGFWTASVVDADTDADVPWLATEFIAGPTLRAAAGEAPLDVATCRALLVRLAEALQSIHQAGLVHRDLKPSNVILAQDGPRVIDFGIARKFVDPQLTQTAVIGTAAYMSPEQIRGEALGPASDVFALGATMVYAATGHGPFDTAPAETVAYRVLFQPPDLDGVPAELVQLLLGCLHKDPDSRPTPGQLLDQISGVAAAVVTRLGDWRPPVTPDPASPPSSELSASPIPSVAHSAMGQGSAAAPQSGTRVDPVVLTLADDGRTLGAASQRFPAVLTPPWAPPQEPTSNVDDQEAVWAKAKMVRVGLVMLVLQAVATVAVIVRHVQTINMITSGGYPDVFEKSSTYIYVNQYQLQHATLALMGLYTAATIFSAIWWMGNRRRSPRSRRGIASVFAIVTAGYSINGIDIATGVVTRVTTRGPWLDAMRFLDSAMPWYPAITNSITVAMVILGSYAVISCLRRN